MKMRVNPPGLSDDVSGQGIEISRLELGGFPISEDVTDNRVLAFERGEGLLVRLVLAGLGLFRFIRESEFIKKDLA